MSQAEVMIWVMRVITPPPLLPTREPGRRKIKAYRTWTSSTASGVEDDVVCNREPIRLVRYRFRQVFLRNEAPACASRQFLEPLEDHVVFGKFSVCLTQARGGHAPAV